MSSYEYIYEHIQYSVKFSFLNIFVLGFGQKCDIHVTMSMTQGLMNPGLSVQSVKYRSSTLALTHYQNCILAVTQDIYHTTQE